MRRGAQCRSSTQVPFLTAGALRPLRSRTWPRFACFAARCGGFGGKQEMLTEDIVRWPRCGRRPVKLEFTREEQFIRRHGGIRCEWTVKEERAETERYVAAVCMSCRNTGAYGNPRRPVLYHPAAINRGSTVCSRIRRSTACRLLPINVRPAAFRGYGSASIRNFAVESGSTSWHAPSGWTRLSFAAESHSQNFGGEAMGSAGHARSRRRLSQQRPQSVLGLVRDALRQRRTRTDLLRSAGRRERLAPP